MQRRVIEVTRASMSDKAIFLDRDDTLIEDPGYISDPEQVRLIDGVASALVDFRRMGYKLIVVSNQSAVARGIVTEKKLGRIHDRMKELLAEEGVFLDGIYYCPYHPEGAIPKYRKVSDDRKPSPGMLLTAAREMGIDLVYSWMIGNSPSDIEAGFRAGCRTILVEPPSRQRQVERFAHAPDYRAINLREAATIVKKYGRSDSTAGTSAIQAVPDQEGTEMSTCETKTEDSGVNSHEPVTKTVAPQGDVPDSEQGESTASGAAIHPEPDSDYSPGPKFEPPAVQEPVSGQTGQPLTRIDGEAKPAVVEFERPPTGTPESEDKEEGLDLPVADLQEKHQAGVEDLLGAILDELRSMQRKDQYGEFSVMRLMAGIVQVLVLFCLVITVWFLMSPKSREGAVAVSLGLAAVLQLMALTFYTMHGRK